MSNYEPQIWYRCTVVALNKSSGKATILYDQDGAYEDVRIPNSSIILLGTPARPAGPSGPRPESAAEPARLPLRVGDAVVEGVPGSAKGRIWVVARALDDGLAMLRSRVGSAAVRHVSELWAPTVQAAADWKHYVTQVRLALHCAAFFVASETCVVC